MYRRSRIKKFGAPGHKKLITPSSILYLLYFITLKFYHPGVTPPSLRSPENTFPVKDKESNPVPKVNCRKYVWSQLNHVRCICGHE